MIKKILNIIIWTRVNPSVFGICFYTFISIRKFLEDSVYGYKKWLEKIEDIKVLDFWCWNQPYKYIFSNDIYYWCDIWTSPEYNNKMSIILEWEKLPYNDNEFDILICTEVLEHIKYPEFYSTEFARILKTGWLFLITVPQIWNYHPYPQHFFNYTPDWLNLFFWDKFSSSKIFSDTNAFQTWIFFTMMYMNNLPIFIRGPYIFLNNLIFMNFPKYQKYNDSSLSIFAYYIK